MNYHNITHDDMLNGDGLRVVLWVAGCSHYCKNCHNEVTWNPNGGIPFDDKAKEEIFKELSKDYISGITFSGGDPLHPLNRETITALAREINALFPTKTIWLYSGYTYEEVRDLDIFNCLDVFIDGKYEESKRCPETPWIGSYNQVIHRFVRGEK